MARRFHILTLLAALAAALAFFGGGALAQTTTNNMPIPGNVCSGAGDLLVAVTADDVNCIGAVATGQVLTSAGVDTLPAWSATPTLTSLTLGASGTAITQATVYDVFITKQTSLAANLITEVVVPVIGVTDADSTMTWNAPGMDSWVHIVNVRPSPGGGGVIVAFANLSAVAWSSYEGTYTITAWRS